MISSSINTILYIIILIVGCNKNDFDRFYELKLSLLFNNSSSLKSVHYWHIHIH